MLKHQVVWPKLAVTNPKGGEEQIVKRGDMLPDWVDDFTRFVLAGSGGVKAVETPDPALTETTPEPVRLQEHKPTGGTETAEEVDGRPKDYAPKPEWVAYAVSRRPEGVSEEDARAEAEGKSKADLITQYGASRQDDQRV